MAKVGANAYPIQVDQQLLLTAFVRLEKKGARWIGSRQVEINELF